MSDRSIDYVVGATEIDRALRGACAQDRLRLLIDLRRTSAAHLSRMIRVSNAKMLRIIRGQPPTYREAIAIANALRAPVDVIFSGKAASRHVKDVYIPPEWR